MLIKPLNFYSCTQLLIKIRKLTILISTVGTNVETSVKNQSFIDSSHSFHFLSSSSNLSHTKLRNFKANFIALNHGKFKALEIGRAHV